MLEIRLSNGKLFNLTAPKFRSVCSDANIGPRVPQDLTQATARDCFASLNFSQRLRFIKAAVALTPAPGDPIPAVPRSQPPRMSPTAPRPPRPRSLPKKSTTTELPKEPSIPRLAPRSLPPVKSGSTVNTTGNAKRPTSVPTRNFPPRRLDRSPNTGNAGIGIRRMDSLSRLFDVRGAVVTAVGFNPFTSTINIATNFHPPGLPGTLNLRQQVLRKYVAGRISLETATAGMGRPPGSRGTNPTSLKRLQRDLRKIKGSLATNSKEAKTTRQFSIPYRQAILDRTWSLVGGGDGVHAELDLAQWIQAGFIGVTKLNCGDCAEHLKDSPSIHTRGTHGFRFRGWKDPETRSNAFHTPSIGRTTHDEMAPDQSDSEEGDL